MCAANVVRRRAAADRGSSSQVSDGNAQRDRFEVSPCVVARASRARSVPAAEGGRTRAETSRPATRGRLRKAWEPAAKEYIRAFLFGDGCIIRLLSVCVNPRLPQP